MCEWLDFPHFFLRRQLIRWNNGSIAPCSTTCISNLYAPVDPTNDACAIETDDVGTWPLVHWDFSIGSPVCSLYFVALE
jgi:hypothetical protein